MPTFRHWLQLAVAITLVIGLCWLWLSQQSNRLIRVGYFRSMPYMSSSAQGNPEGFVVDSFEEVARRLDYKIQWVNTTGRVEQALLQGEVDLYPQLLRTPSRLKQFAISDPWWELTLVLVSRQDAAVRVPADLRGKVVSVFKGSFASRLVEAHFEGARLIEVTGNDEVIRPLCDGQAAASLADSRALNLLLLRADRPCPGLSLHIQPFPELTLSYGVATRKADASLGDAVQSVLLDMSLDGTMNRLGARWNVYATNQFGTFRDLLQIKHQRFWLLTLVTGLLAGLVGCAVVYYRMRQARREALAATEMQARFLANMSHEMRTPLNGVLGMANLLATTELQPMQRDYLQAVTSSGEVLLTLINDCLDLAKIESGKLELEAIALDVEMLLEEVTQLLAPKAQAKGLEIGCFIDPLIGTNLVGDPTRLKQVLYNLAGNAVKFTAQGEVWLEARLVSGQRVRFTVTDTGVGISDQARTKLFERFTQADSSTTRQFGGTGLGLAISRELVQRMHGEIGFDSRPEGGSRFWFDLPITVTRTPVLEQFGKRVWYEKPTSLSQRLLGELLPAWGASLAGGPASADIVIDASQWPKPLRQSRLRRILQDLSSRPKPAPIAPSEKLGLRILVAEDNLVNQRLILSFLAKLGCDVVLVENGELAVAAATSTAFDLILMDYQMPVLDGLAAAIQIRAQQAGGRRTPIVAVTAGVMGLDTDQWAAAGVDQILAKPYSMESLRQTLLRYREMKRPVTGD
jgi:signal transduction histidine kinase/ActR/RegA family two-component response regulator